MLDGVEGAGKGGHEVVDVDVATYRSGMLGALQERAHRGPNSAAESGAVTRRSNSLPASALFSGVL